MAAVRNVYYSTDFKHSAQFNFTFQLKGKQIVDEPTIWYSPPVGTVHRLVQYTSWYSTPGFRVDRHVTSHQGRFKMANKRHQVGNEEPFNIGHNSHSDL